MQLSLYQVALSLLLRVHVTVPGRREAMCGDNKPNYSTVRTVQSPQTFLQDAAFTSFDQRFNGPSFGARAEAEEMRDAMQAMAMDGEAAV